MKKMIYRMAIAVFDLVGFLAGLLIISKPSFLLMRRRSSISYF